MACILHTLNTKRTTISRIPLILAAFVLLLLFAAAVLTSFHAASENLSGFNSQLLSLYQKLRCGKTPNLDYVTQIFS